MEPEKNRPGILFALEIFAIFTTFQHHMAANTACDSERYKNLVRAYKYLQNHTAIDSRAFMHKQHQK